VKIDRFGAMRRKNILLHSVLSVLCLFLVVSEAMGEGIVTVRTGKSVYVSSEPVYILYALRGLEAGYGINLGLSIEMPDGSVAFLGQDAIFSPSHPLWLITDWPFSPVNIGDGEFPLLFVSGFTPVPGRYVLTADVYDAATEVLIDRSRFEFYLVDAPYVDHIDPAQGVTGDVVRIYGQNFGANPDIVKVMLGGREATIMEISDDSIVVWVPYGALTGTVTVSVDGVLSNPVDFLVGPYIESVSASVLEPGTRLTIKGFNFDADINKNYVYFNGIRGTVERASETQIDVIVPDGNTGPMHVVVNEMSSNVEYVTLTPVVDSLVPETGNEGDTVTISGWNFNPVLTNNYVVFNAGTADEVAATVLEASSTQLLVRVPASETGKVIVYTDGQAASGDVSFTYPPVTTDISPSEIMAGDNIVITGFNFDDIEQKNTVMVGGQTLTVTSATPHEIQARTPVGLTSGSVTVTVNGLSSMEGQFLTVYPAPVLSDISPAVVDAGDTTTSIVVEGVGFASGIRVTVSGNGREYNPAVTVSDYNDMSFVLPSGIASGAYTVTATRSIAGRSLESNSLNLVVR
jgi:hypothetical protein